MAVGASTKSIETYSPSGRVGPLAIPFALLGGLAAALVLGCAYQAVLDLRPRFYFVFIATIACGCAIGLAVGYGFRFGKGRNSRIGAGIAITCALCVDAVSFYYSYHSETNSAAAEVREMLQSEGIGNDLDDLDIAETDKEIMRAIMHDADGGRGVRRVVGFRRYLGLRLEEGRSIRRLGRDLPVKGAMLFGVWALEALVLCVFAAVAQEKARPEPFCEHCGVWTKAAKLGTIRAVDYQAMGAAARTGDLDAIVAPQTKERGSKDASYKLHACSGCDEAYLTVSMIWAGRKDGAKREKKSRALVERVLVTPAQVATVRAAIENRRPMTRTTAPEREPPEREILVKCRRDGKATWQPVQALDLGDGRFRLPRGGYSAAETWEFAAGSVVRCEPRKLRSGKTHLVAVAPDSKPPAA